MTRYKKFLIIIPTAATMAALAAFSASAYEPSNIDNTNAPITMSNTGTKPLSNDEAIKEDMESNYGGAEIEKQDEGENEAE